MQVSEIKQLTRLLDEFQLENTPKLIKQLIIIGIHALRNKNIEISNEAIQLVASSCKEQTLQHELKCLRKKVNNLEHHIQQNKVVSVEREPKYHSQPKLTPKVTESIPPLTGKVQRYAPFKHHLDDTEIKSILWSQYDSEQQQTQVAPSHRQQLSYDSSSNQLTSREQSIREQSIREQSVREQSVRNTQRSSHSTDRNSPKFKNESKRILNKENKHPSVDKVPKHLKNVESKIKEHVKLDRDQYRSSNHQTRYVPPEQTTPQHKYFQPCNSTQFGGLVSSALDSGRQQPIITTDRKIVNLDEIANSFLNSPFLKSHVKQRLFKQSNHKESGFQSSVSSNFSLFNPKDELRNFFQRELDSKIPQSNTLSFQF